MQTKDRTTVYKIRDRATELFSTGGIEPSWTKTGKAWPSRGALKAHLTQYTNPGVYDYNTQTYVKRTVPETWEVVEYVFVLSESSVFSAKEESERPAKK